MESASVPVSKVEEELVPKRNCTSVVWNYFGFSGTDKDQTNIICKICRIEHLKATDGNTTGLRNHLKCKHPKEYADSSTTQGPPRVSAKATAAAAQPKQATITQSFERATAYEKTSKRQTELTEAVAFFLAKDMRPIRTVEGEGFLRLMKKADPRFVVPDRKYFSKKAIPRMYTDCREQVQERVKSAQFFATTSDLWSSRTSEPYLSLTVHFIHKWKLESACLQTMYFPEDHTADLIANGLRDLLHGWGLNEDNMTCMTTDSGSNMVKALQLNGWTRLQCFGHRLHLAIGE